MRKRIWPHKLWIRLFQARRLARRLQRKLDVIQTRHADEVAAIKDHYEEHIAIERARGDRIQTEMTSRLLQAMRLQPMLVTDLDEDITNPKFRYQPKPEDVMSADAAERYAEEKERFFEEGVQNGLSLAAIMERWKEVEPQVIEEIG
jgi:hypothetical protein